MKVLLTIFLISSVLVSCLINKPDRITPRVTIYGKLDTADIEFNNGRYYSTRIDLLNNSNNALDYWTMSCSWQSNWISDNKSIRLFVNCPKNIPVVIQIKPFETISHYGIIELADSTDLPAIQNLKLGFVLVEKNEVSNKMDFIRILRNKIESNKDIHWSNSFNIKP
jgi:hypothetical protein